MGAIKSPIILEMAYSQFMCSDTDRDSFSVHLDVHRRCEKCALIYIAVQSRPYAM